MDTIKLKPKIMTTKGFAITGIITLFVIAMLIGLTNGNKTISGRNIQNDKK